MEDIESTGRRMAHAFPADPAFVSRARHTLREFLISHVSEEVMETAALLVSELAANAVVHARSAFTLTAELSTDRLRVGVEDASTQLPLVRRPIQSSPSGRGMLLVEALSCRWGVESRPGGKSVWFELPLC